MITDPQNAALVLFKLSNPELDHLPEPLTPGHVGWHELLATDWEKVFPFYRDLFGWSKADAVDLGPMGTYQLFSLDGQTLGVFADPFDLAATPIQVDIAWSASVLPRRTAVRGHGDPVGGMSHGGAVHALAVSLDHKY